MTIDLSPWQNKDPLTLSEVKYLWAGLPPNLSWKTLKEKYPEQLAAAQEIGGQLHKRAEAGLVEYERPDVDHVVTRQVRAIHRGWDSEFSTGHQHNIKTITKGPVSWDGALFSRAALKEYADSIGQRPAFLFPESADVGALRCLDKTHPHFSAELEAAVMAWVSASERANGAKKKPKQLIEDYLSNNWHGSEEAAKRIATLANWDKKTGPKAI